MKMTIDRKNLNSLLENKDQNEVGVYIMEFASKIKKIESIQDIALLCK